MKVLNIEARSDVDVLPVVRTALPKLKNKVGLVTTIQHIEEVDKAERFLESKGKRVFIGRGATYRGQILGCNVKAATKIESKVDCFLYIGTGEFHPLGVALETNKKVVVANPFSRQVREISEEEKRKYLAKKAARIAKAKECRSFGILVSTKPGQHNMKAAEKLKQKLGNKAYVFLADTIRAEDLMNFPDIECWVNTACPRLIDDDFGKLVINRDEI